MGLIFAFSQLFFYFFSFFLYCSISSSCLLCLVPIPSPLYQFWFHIYMMMPLPIFLMISLPLSYIYSSYVTHIDTAIGFTYDRVYIALVLLNLDILHNNDFQIHLYSHIGHHSMFYMPESNSFVNMFHSSFTQSFIFELPCYCIF